MFKTTTPVTEPDAPDDVVPADPIPISYLALDLPAPPEVGGWTAFLAAKGIEVVTDDLGRLAISRGDARRLFAERREAEAHAQQVAAERDRQAIEADRMRMAQIWTGVPWYELADGLTPTQALGAADRPTGPGRRPPVIDFLDNDGGTVFHPIRNTPDED